MVVCSVCSGSMMGIEMEVWQAVWMAERCWPLVWMQNYMRLHGNDALSLHAYGIHTWCSSITPCLCQPSHFLLILQCRSANSPMYSHLHVSSLALAIQVSTSAADPNLTLTTCVQALQTVALKQYYPLHLVFAWQTASRLPFCIATWAYWTLLGQGSLGWQEAFAK